MTQLVYLSIAFRLSKDKVPVFNNIPAFAILQNKTAFIINHIPASFVFLFRTLVPSPGFVEQFPQNAFVSQPSESDTFATLTWLTPRPRKMPGRNHTSSRLSEDKRKGHRRYAC